MNDFEVLLRDALIVDGTGDPPFMGHVAIGGDTITSVVRSFEPAPGKAQVLIDCAGQALVPGFIDIHTHSDVSFVLDPLASSKVMQGVTTEVVGNCGFSPFPVHPQRRGLLEEFLRGLGAPTVSVTWSDFDGYAATVQACAPIMNVAPLVGHGALRIAAIGNADVPVTPELLGTLTRQLSKCLDDGAFGLSTGLTYVPSRFADTPEIHALADVVRDAGALYATHARADAAGFGAFDEAIEVGRRTGVRAQFSHVALNDPAMWGRADDVLRRFEVATDSGVDIRYDVYPYDASASSLTQYLPGWLQEDGEASLRERLGDRPLRERAARELSHGLFGHIPWQWDRIMVSLAGPGDEHLEGKSIAADAVDRGLTAEHLCLELCARHGNNVQVILFYRQESDVEEFLRHRLAIIGSDGNAMAVTSPGRPHPRSFGAHSRLLERYVVDRKLMSLAEAINKATLEPAQRLGLSDRGKIAVGGRADLVVLDPGRVRETATWTRPQRLAQGVDQVWINGAQVVAQGELTGRRPGRVLRRSGSDLCAMTT